jgi:hypothetical protein
MNIMPFILGLIKILKALLGSGFSTASNEALPNTKALCSTSFVPAPGVWRHFIPNEKKTKRLQPKSYSNCAHKEYVEGGVKK